MSRIAIITTMSGFPWGGSEYLWAATAEEAITQGHEVFISLFDWSIKHPLVQKLYDKGAKLFPRPRFPSPPSLVSRARRKFGQKIPFVKPSFYRSFYSPIFDCQPDFICISQGSSYDILHIPDLIDYIGSNSIPYILLCHFNSDTSILSQDLITKAKSIFQKAAKIAFVSDQNLKLAQRQLAQSLPNAIVVQNPVNMQDISIIPCPKNKASIQFASVARLEVAFKGQDILFETLSSSLWCDRDWQCNLYGSGCDRSYLQELAKYYNISHKIRFMDHAPDVRSIWAENHILLMPSRGEGTPLSLVEAMLCGRPSVVTDVGGNVDWITESKTGFIADAPTVKLFSEALDRAWQNQNSWEQMGVMAHEYASAKFDISPAKTLLKIIIDSIPN